MEERKKEAHEKRAFPALIRETIEMMSEAMRYSGRLF